ncbi:hypothetical protein [Legionella tucsonensis]|uniref:Ankyrin repeat protein n=1 Tax=Legionella tucsonensis TaxID=40335 RepID=A0A0W0ZS37_9GAMM|nr:hypothetical protein [Legionella tucsonensis]KTD71864.1 ankyrin repeat protein [Legionella tucsonensis]
METKSDKSLLTPRDIGRSDLFIEDLGKYQILVQTWINKLEKQVKETPHDNSQLKFGKILEYLLHHNFQQIGFKNAKFNPLNSKDDYWEDPFHEWKRTESGLQVIKYAYRIYFTGINSDSEDLGANTNVKILYLTTITNEGLIAFSFEDKIEPIDFNLFKELAIHLEVKSDAWSHLINFEETLKSTSNAHLISQILGLILYLNINPDCGDDIFYKMFSLLEKSTDDAFNSTIVALLKDTPEYENKVVTFIRNNLINYTENEIHTRGKLFKLSTNNINSLISEMREAKALQEQHNKVHQERELKKDLIEAIDEYLDWRKNHKTTKGYQRDTGTFSWLRHFTNFGKNRATALKSALQNAEDLDSIGTILHAHFNSNSRLNNHSLDSYLVRSLYEKNNNFKSLFNFEHISYEKNKDSKAIRNIIKDSFLEQIKHVDDEPNTPTLSNKTKIGLNVTKIPESEREENILAILTVLNNDELLKNKDDTIPAIIEEIREIVGKLDSSKEEEIVDAIIDIKTKIADCSDSIDNEHALNIIEAFNIPDGNFKKIRAALAVDKEIKHIMDSISGTALQNKIDL